MPLHLTVQSYKRLRAAANRELQAAWSSDFGPADRAYEVPCIRNLIDIALPRIDRCWSAMMPHGTRLHLQGVVCHGRPYVSFPGSSGSCELGDLLLVHDHFDHGRLTDRRAALVQAKLFGSGGVASRNANQLLLYRNWPAFQYTQWPGGMQRLVDLLEASARVPASDPDLLLRDVAVSQSARASPAEVLTGARYGMIDAPDVQKKRFSYWPNAWRLCDPSASGLYTSLDGMSLAGYLLGLIEGSAGRLVPRPGWPTGLRQACQWSLVVEELLALLPPSSSTSATNLMNFGSAGARLPPGHTDQTGPDRDEDAFGVILAVTEGGGLDDDRRRGSG